MVYAGVVRWGIEGVDCADERGVRGARDGEVGLRSRASARSCGRHGDHAGICQLVHGLDLFVAALASDLGDAEGCVWKQGSSQVESLRCP